MTLDVSAVVCDYEGKPVVDAQTKEQVTYRKVFVGALNTPIDKENLTGEQKAKIYHLSCLLYDSDSLDMTVEQMALIKDRVSKLYTPLFYGRTCELFGERG